MLDHEQAVALLPELHDGSLGGASRAELEQHLGQCDDCRGLAATYAAIDATLREHPSSSDIVAFALGEGALLPGARARIDEHTSECATCQDEVDRTRRAHARANELASVTPIRRAWPKAARYAALAASLLVVVLAIDDARLRQKPAGGGHAGGAVDFKVLSSALRDEVEPETIAVAADQPYVPIALAVERAATLPAAGEVRFEIVSEAGASVWSLTLPMARVQQDMRATGIVTLLVPASRFAVGRYTVAVAVGDVELLAVDFRISR